MFKNDLLPLNLQFFADGGNEDEGGNDKPSYEDLVKQLASANANLEKLKTAKDNATSQAAEFKKQLRELMDDEQKKEAERKDAEESRNKELDDLRKAVGKMKAVEKYRRMGMDEALAEEAADAEVGGDQDKVTECLEKHIKAVKADAYQQFLDDRKDPNSGRGSGENTVAEDLAKKSAGSRGSADTNILNQYMVGGN